MADDEAEMSRKRKLLPGIVGELYGAASVAVVLLRPKAERCPQSAEALAHERLAHAMRHTRALLDLAGAELDDAPASPPAAAAVAAAGQLRATLNVAELDALTAPPAPPATLTERSLPNAPNDDETPAPPGRS